MKLTFWGTRGSIPAPGPHTYRVGGNTTCVEIETGTDDRIIIDAGTGMRQLGLKIAQEQVKPVLHLLLTHSHWDHLAGFSFFTPAFMAHIQLKVYGNLMAQDVIRRDIYERRDNRYYPVNMDVLRADCTFNNILPDPLVIAGVKISTLPLNHPGSGYAYRLEQAGKSVTFITDNEIGAGYNGGGHSPEQLVEFCRGTDVLIHDGQYLPEEIPSHKGWGHSSYDTVLDLAHSAGLKTVYLTHHDPERSDDQCDELLKSARAYIAEHKYKIDCYLAIEGDSITV